MTRSGIVVVDDYFPSVGTGFRIAEFSWLLRRGVVDEVLTTITPLDEVIAWYSAAHPLVWERVRRFDVEALAQHELAYVLFLNNAHHHLEDFERAETPFVVTLYPGGGLNLGEPEAERKLERVLASPMLRHVITTQPIVTDRVRGSLRAGVELTEIPGVVVDPEYLAPGPGHRQDYHDPADADSVLRICFVAHRYTRHGADKGFPEFVEVAARLAADGRRVRASVVGDFTADDLPEALRDVPVDFLGVLPTVELRRFFAEQDVILSPTRPDVLAPGAFDGFPTGASIEAALSGVAVAASDVRGQNRAFNDRRDIVITAPDAAAIVERLRAVLDRPGELRRLAQAGLATARAEYSVDRQLWSRRGVLEETLETVRRAD